MIRPKVEALSRAGPLLQTRPSRMQSAGYLPAHRPLRVLVLSMNYAPEEIAIGLYSTGLAESLARKGLAVDVVAAKPYYPAWRVADGWRRPGWRRRRGAAGERIVHCPLYVPKDPRGLRRILHYLSFAASALPVLCWCALWRRPDVVFAVAPSLMSARMARIAARLSGARSWLHVQDFEVEAAMATGQLHNTGRLARLALGFEGRVLRAFDRVSTISAPMQAKLREKGVDPNRICELRNWAHADQVRPLKRPSRFRTDFGITTRHVALYSGNLAYKQGLEILPEMARRLAHRSDLTFVVCGDGPMRSTLAAACAEMPNVRLFPLQPLAELGELLGLADVHILPQIAGAADLVLPSKLTNMLASGRPVLATAAEGTALAHEVRGAGVISPPGDAAAAAAVLELLLDSPRRRIELGRRARIRAERRWNRDAILSRLSEEIDALAGHGRRA